VTRSDRTWKVGAVLGDNPGWIVVDRPVTLR
jgi:hypothetical protein